MDQENTGQNYVCAGVSEEPKTDGEGFEASRQYVEKLEVARNFGTETTRAALLPNSEATNDPRFNEIEAAWQLADDSQRDAILEVIRRAMLEGGAA